MKSSRFFVALLACIGCTGCAAQDSWRNFIHGDPVVSGAPEINDNVFLLRKDGQDESSYIDTGKVVPAPCQPFMEHQEQTAQSAQTSPPLLASQKQTAQNASTDPPSDQKQTAQSAPTGPDQIKLCVYAMHELIDVRWHRLEHEVSAALSTSNFVADVTVLGVTTAATLASVDSAKILSAIAAGITGTRKSWDEDVLYSYSIQEILLQMRTDRALADAQIQARLSGARPYGNIYEAVNDLFNYDIAGSWEHAMSSLQLNVAATTAACQARLRNQQMASAAGNSQVIVPVASTATDPCNSGQVQSIISKDDILGGAIFWLKDKSTIMIVDADKSSGKLSYKTMQPDGTWSKDATRSDADSLLPKLVLRLRPGSS